ncbi:MULTISPECIES: hypothetical protein [unclassified Nocardioides]|uniref:hypothetical protein n=1 Tax=unclassified Nocardioides TaxID=2615069 RepID=UPI0006FF1CB8|nr:MULTISPECIES: hypothetical protein [unclassified Nocardioides]KQY64416.1 hypothetical protein ASD30_05635 [Nocardioides sp. Root140]KRF18187.1 hypothetical protein ASH02_01020 [Nocardioides sp. Soil796]
MKLYADHRPRRARQIAADVFFVVWIGFWIWQGVSTFQSTMELTKPTERTQRAATSLADNMGEAAESLGSIPLLGDAAASPFLKAEASAQELADAGDRTEHSLRVLAWKLGLSLGLGPGVLLGAFYLPPRIRFIRNATAGRGFVDSTHDIDLFALRALANQPLHVLARISDDPAGAWRQGDPAVIRALAHLELRDSGLAPPPGL